MAVAFVWRYREEDRTFAWPFLHLDPHNKKTIKNVLTSRVLWSRSDNFFCSDLDANCSFTQTSLSLPLEPHLLGDNLEFCSTEG